MPYQSISDPAAAALGSSLLNRLPFVSKRWPVQSFSSAGLTTLVVLIAALVLLPLGSLLLSWQDVQWDVWKHLFETQLGGLIWNTLVLVFGVAAGVTVLGTALAALISLCDFPGRRWLEWALMLPFAIPAYVLAFVYLGVFDFSGPLQSWMRTNIDGFTWVDIRSPLGVITVLVLVFYPYVYMLARGAFQGQGRSLYEASRLLGMSAQRTFWRVTLPVARPAIIGGAILAVMETLADFGTVSVFNYDTFTTAIYKSWFGFFNLKAAAQLASLLLAFIVMILILEKQLKGRVGQSERQRVMPRHQLQGMNKWFATGFCSVVFVLAFLLPVVQLGWWIYSTSLSDLNARYMRLVTNTLLLAGLAAIATVAAASVLVLAKRFQPGRLSSWSEQIGSLGYAMPGALLAVAVMMLFGFLDNHVITTVQTWLGLQAKPLLLGSVFALVLAYLIRFLAVALKPVTAAFDRVRPTMHEAARILGHSPLSVSRRVYIPMVMPGLLTAMLLVFVDVLKEMPATLLMRPFGWDTLAVRIFEMTAEAEWERAALPAMSLILVGMIPVIALIRRSRVG
ncbi:ABC transporter permease [Sansalvadorimonas verongulae]|uniref:ABC transporter permease n=1 Tax=Sansalvadorimonas verongulae TaxID=2172824 RepID=UPI0012BCD4FD|nr:iron ABC transporter permease [Sansalvadorimonas verongulae]MTI13297.1 iron ABC transporter permease [Sansalvadorimonas verongulae]